jgi:XTP/dITP diphosphohydrolase
MVGSTTSARILIATTNIGKIREIREALAGLPLDLLTLADIPPVSEPPEIGRTFSENARIKAEAYARASGLPVVAEDSGLAIDALGGRPGVASARYPGETYADKFANLYRELAGAPRPWTARFICALVLLDSAGALGAEPEYQAEGTVEGEIADGPSGRNGFGYDPIFFYPPFGATLGAVEQTQKMAVSHRGKAFRQLRTYLAHIQPLRSDSPRG